MKPLIFKYDQVRTVETHRIQLQNHFDQNYASFYIKIIYRRYPDLKFPKFLLLLHSMNEPS